MPQAIDYALSFQPSLQVWMIDLYNTVFQVGRERLARFMDLDMPSFGLRTEKIFYPLDVPTFARWDYGAPVPQGNFGAVQFSVSVLRFGLKMEYELDDVQDDTTRSLIRHVSENMAERAAQFDDRVQAQLVTGAANPELLPNGAPNASDGAAYFSATDGAGANRYGVSGGNVFSGAGVAFQQQVMGDYFKALNSRLRLFKDTHLEPFHAEGVEEQGVGIQFAPGNGQVFSEAFRQLRRLRMDATVSPAVGAAESNIAMDMNRSVELWPNPRLTGNSWFLTLTGFRRKGTFKIAREPFSVRPYDLGNSDKAADLNVGGYRAKFRAAYGIGSAIQSVEVTNS